VPPVIESEQTESSNFDHQLWQGLIEDFGALGGTLENVAPRLTRTGLTLISENRAHSVLLRAPRNLLFRPEDMVLEGDHVRIGATTEQNQHERAFFERYLAAVAWTGAGGASCARLIDLFDQLDPGLRTRLAEEFGMNRFIEGPRETRILRLFVSGRTVGLRGESLFAPFIDLMKRGNRGLHASAGPQGGVEIRGEAEGPLFLAFGHHDTLGVFRKYGVERPRPHAFSLATQFKVGPLELAVQRDPLTSIQRSGMRMPQLRLESGTIHLSHVMLGNLRFPRTPRAIFRALMREAEVGHSDAIFDRILYFNRTRFLSLLEALEPHSGELVTRLRHVALFQLAALAECAGAREL
jgi:hypothetical protein